MPRAADFLGDARLRPVRMPYGSPFKPIGLALGSGPSALEVLLASHEQQPALPALRSTWKARKGGRAAPLLLVVLYGDQAALCGPAGEDAPAHVGLDPGQVERICKEALEQPDRHAALRALATIPPKNATMYVYRLSSFVLYQLLRDERLLARVRQEIDAAFAHGDPDLGDLKSMRLLQRVILECLRLHPLATALPR